MTPNRLPSGVLSAREFDELFAAVCNWNRWGRDDERGTLNYITPDHVRGAASLVRAGRTVSLSLAINKEAGPDEPRPAQHNMVRRFDPSSSGNEPRMATDFLASEIHGNSKTHLDALCHCAYKGKLYNSNSTDLITSRGATRLEVTAYSHGIVGRGVLLDVPRMRGVEWLEPGETVTREDLEECERTQGVRLREGDIFLFRTGHHRRRMALGPWDSSADGQGRAGLHAAAILLLHERKVAAFFPDGDGEAVPSNVEGMSSPIHALQITAMGMACADNLQLEDLAEECVNARRWEFMVVASPLRLPGGTGSLFNPIAIF
ncbi:MAG: cyclase family protein [Terriglobia bacterium]